MGRGKGRFREDSDCLEMLNEMYPPDMAEKFPVLGSYDVQIWESEFSNTEGKALMNEKKERLLKEMSRLRERMADLENRVDKLDRLDRLKDFPVLDGLDNPNREGSVIYVAVLYARRNRMYVYVLYRDGNDWYTTGVKGSRTTEEIYTWLTADTVTVKGAGALANLSTGGL